MEHKKLMRARDSERGREISRVTWVGFWINLALGLFKIGAGYSGNSRAVLADGFHTLSDLVTDLAVLVGVRFWMAPPDERHPYGYKRLESLISFGIGLLLALVGAGLVWDAASALGHKAAAPAGGFLALFAALTSVLVKEILFRWTRRKARAAKSDALEANAWHHRSDALSSLPVALAVGLAMLSPALAFVDLVGALLVAAFILHAAWKICRGAAHALVDGGCGAEAGARLLAFTRSLDGVRDVHDLRTRCVGQGLQVDMHICVDPELTVLQGNRIAHNVEDALYSLRAAEAIGLEVVDAVIHIDPWLPGKDKVR